MWALAVALLLVQAADPVSDGLKALEEGRNEAAVQSFTEPWQPIPRTTFPISTWRWRTGLCGATSKAAAEYRKTLELKPELV